MSQITCCPSCGTKFKVVADQLRISEGWVRCGHCKEIFDATAHLQAAVAVETLLPDFALEDWSPSPQEAAPEAPTPAAVDWPIPQVPAFLAAPVPGPKEAPAPAFRWSGGETPAPEAPAPMVAAALPHPVQEPPTESPLELEGYELPFAELRSEDQEPLKEADSEPVPAPVLDEAPVAPDTATEEALVPALSPAKALSNDEEDEDDEPLAPQPEPGFVRAARRQAFWRSTGMRALLLLCGLVLAGGLAAQVALRERDRVVAWEPRLRPLLSMACSRLGCALGPRKDIAAVAIDSSAFNKAARGDTYQLGLTLSSHAATPVATPAIELTLTDAQEQPVLRRVLLPAELGAPAELAGRGEWSGQASVALTGPALRLAGYRVLAFYP